MKNRYFLFLILFSSLTLAACNTADLNSQTETDTNNSSELNVDSQEVVESDLTDLNCPEEEMITFKQLPLEEIEAFAKINLPHYGYENAEQGTLYEIKSIDKVHCLPHEPEKALIVTLNTDLKASLDLEEESRAFFERNIPQLLAVLTPSNAQEESWHLVWLDESIAPVKLEPREKNRMHVQLGHTGYTLELNEENKIIFGMREYVDGDFQIFYYLNYHPLHIYSVNSWSENASEDIYFTEVLDIGSRLYKKVNDNYELLGASPLKLIPISILTSQSTGNDLIYFNQFLPESDGPRSGLIRYEVTGQPHSNFEILEIGRGLISFGMEESISPDRKKILSSWIDETSVLEVIDLENETIKTIESLDVASGYTLDSGEFHFGAPEAEAKWLDDQTVEYNVYKIKGDFNEYKFNEYEKEVEFFETRTYKVQ